MRAFNTDRLHLRPLGEQDGALYCSLYTDPELMTHIAPPLSEERAHRSFSAVLGNKGKQRLVWVIGERESRVDHGILGVVPDSQGAEIGVMLLPTGQRRGFAAEAIQVIADHLFRDACAQRLWTRQAIGNRAVPILMAKLGFDPLRDGSELPREIRWQITRQSWSARQAPVAVREGAR